MQLDPTKMSLRTRLGRGMMFPPAPGTVAFNFLADTPADWIDISIIPPTEPSPDAEPC